MYARILLFFFLVLSSTAAVASNWEVTPFPLERNGLTLHLQRLLRKDAGSVKPLLLLHGLTYSSHEFDIQHEDYSLARYFADNGYCVWMLDIAGYGQSEKPRDGFAVDSDYAAEDVAAAARLILGQSGRDRLDVLGWSWGTLTASKFAKKYPGMVNRLVLYAPIMSGLGEADVAFPFHRTNWEHAADDFPKIADGSIDFNIVAPEVAALYLSNCWRYDGAGSPNGGRRELLVSPDRQLIDPAAFKRPVLLIAGDNDNYINISLCAEATKRLPSGSGFAVIKGGFHTMMMEKSTYKIFRETVLRFLND